MYYLESQIFWCILLREDMELVSWMYIRVYLCEVNKMPTKHWDALTRGMAWVLQNLGWWWLMMVLCLKWFEIYCLTFLTCIHPPLLCFNAKEIVSRTCIVPHIPKLGFLMASSFGESRNHGLTDSIQSYGPSGYVSWPGDVCEEFLGSTKNQSQSAMAHPFSISDFSCFPLMQATTPPAMVVISPPSASMSFIATLLLTGDYSITTVMDGTMPCYVGLVTVFCCTPDSAELASFHHLFCPGRWHCFALTQAAMRAVLSY